jgi:hypothetical protein
MAAPGLRGDRRGRSAPRARFPGSQTQTRRWTMNKVGSLFALGTLAFLALASANGVVAPPRTDSQPVAHAGMDGRMHHRHDAPQSLVVCTGWHALCSKSTDCKVTGDRADCDCLRVDENHIVMTTEIQDAAVKRQTEARCTDAHPCDVDEAPVCKAIAHGQYKVNHVRYDWVSTYSYRGWCGLLPGFTPCDQSVPDYAGDPIWAICDVAPCTEIRNPIDPEKPLTCQCRVVRNVAFVGVNGSCKGDRGGIMSSFPAASWDFQNNTYPVPVPGYEYVQGACAAFASDP